MATPHAMKNQPSQQGRTPQTHGAAAATPAASTPYSQLHAAFSPRGPKSSPQQIKKSPANGATGNMTGNHSHSTPAVNFDSPSAAAFAGALGVGGFDASLDNMGVGQLSGLARLSGEDEREKKLQAVVNVLKKKGIVSEEGLERLAKETGLDYVWEESMGSTKKRTLVIAGRALSLDIVLLDHIVQNVSLAFPESNDFVAQYTHHAEKILLDDLKVSPYESPLLKSLDAFAANLERLATLDKLSILPNLVCHDAIAGIYESLERLHKWDMQKLREDPAFKDRDERFLRTAALCTRSGCPAMHARGRIGLCLDYWQEARLHHPRGLENRKDTKPKPKIWGILVGCAPTPDSLYPPVRVSNKWISDNVEKANPTEEDDLLLDTGPILDWQDPENIMLPSEDPIAGPKFPEVVFMATFDPPVIVPFNVWEQIRSVLAAHNPEELPLATFDSLVFPVPHGSNHNSSEPRTIKCTRQVRFLVKDRQRALRRHNNNLYIYKPVYGHTLTQLPFSHPSQLVVMQPTLRQYTFLSTLLERSFGRKEESAKAAPSSTSQTGTTKVTITTTDNALASYMTSGSAQEGTAQPSSGPVQVEKESSKIDVTLQLHPTPKLQVEFPLQEGTANITLEIRLNGEVSIESQKIISPENDQNKTESGGASHSKVMDKGLKVPPGHLARALEIFEDIDTWCEWIRSQEE